jgi:hypothetical protein
MEIHNFKEYKVEVENILAKLMEIDGFWGVDRKLYNILSEINSNQNLITFYSKHGTENNGGNIIINSEPYLYIAFSTVIQEKLFNYVLKLIEDGVLSDVFIKKESYYSYFKNIKTENVTTIFVSSKKDIITEEVVVIKLYGFSDKTDEFWSELVNLKML